MSEKKISKNERMRRYLYPDDGIRKKVTRLTFWIILLALLTGVFLGIVIASDNPNILLLVLGLVFCVATVTPFIVLLYQCAKKQKALLAAQPDKYIYHIQLQEFSQEFTKKNRIPSLLLIVGGLSMISGIFFELLILLLISLPLYILFIIIYPSRYRTYIKKSEVIYKQIDEHLKNCEAEKVDNDSLVP